MKVRDVKRTMKSLTKFFVDYEGNLYSTQELHEQLARDICQEKGWQWKESEFYSAEDFLLSKGYIKFSNYEQLRYVAVAKKYLNDRKIMGNAFYLADVFNLKIEAY